MTPEACAVIVLASGLSRRFGTSDKLLTNLQGRPLISHVMDAVTSIDFGETFTVVPDGTSIPNIIPHAKIRYIINDRPSDGQGRSLALGTRAVIEAGWSHALVVLADMPFVTTQHLLDLVNHMEDQDAVMSACTGIRMPPSIFGPEALRCLGEQAGQSGGKKALDGLSIATLALSERQARDIDTPDDLAKAQNL